MTTATKNKVEILDAAGVNFIRLNEQIRELVDNGTTEIVLNNVCGQRYIGCGLGPGITLTINGVPGNDMGMFMGGTRIVVNASVQDCVANTMDSGEIVVHGRSGDTLGHGMRGGEIYIRDNVGTRVGIHMKSYESKKPVLVIGGWAGNFLGEYMAGGILIVLGLNRGYRDVVGRFVATGMHGGTMYIRGQVDAFQLGKEVKIFDINELDKTILSKYIRSYCEYFDVSFETVMKEKFIKLEPYTHRPYGKLYAY
jgi:glutamate synthase domain-containing protein 3